MRRILNHDWNLRVSKYENHLPINGGIVSADENVSKCGHNLRIS
jgi:hypothetical protein